MSHDPFTTVPPNYQKIDIRSWVYDTFYFVYRHVE